MADKAALLVGFEPKSSTKGKGDDSDQEYGDPVETACKAVWKAIKKDDYEGFSEALANYVDAKLPDQDEEED